MIVWALLLLVRSAFALEMVGEARDYSGQILYTEHHAIETDEKDLSRKVETEYRKPDGNAFARQSLDFSKNPLLPDVTFEDKRFGIKDEMKFDPASHTVLLRHVVKGKSPKEARLKVDPSMVAAPAFDNYIKLHFQDLVTKSRPVHFVVMSKLDYFRFEALADKSESGASRAFQLRVKNFMLKWFVEDIRVLYESQSKRLKSYQGPSNIRDDKGHTQKVKINYDFLDVVKIR